MSIVIAALTVVIFLDFEKAKLPVIHRKTEIVRQDRLYPMIPKFITTGTYRVRGSTISRTFGVVQGTQDWSGTAFGLDMSEYGLPEKRYLITAAHVALGPAGKPPDNIEIQIRTDTIKEWVKCKILVADKDRDIAVLQAEKDLPIVFKLAEDAEVGAPVIVSGCPVGTTPSAAMGFLTSKDPEIRDKGIKCEIWQASAPFYSGNSGGPVIDAESQKIVGVLIAGLKLAEGGMVPNLAICVPCIEVRKLLDASFKLAEAQLPYDERQPIAEIVPLPPLVPVLPQKK